MLATPRIPSVPNSRAIGQRLAGLADAAGLAPALALVDGLGLPDSMGTPVMMTVTLGGIAATSVVPAGTFAVTGTSTVPEPRPVTSSSATIVDPETVKIGGRAADRQKNLLDPYVVCEVGPGALELQSGTKRSRARDRSKADRDDDLLVSDREDARREVEPDGVCDAA